MALQITCFLFLLIVNLSLEDTPKKPIKGSCKQHYCLKDEDCDDVVWIFDETMYAGCIPYLYPYPMKFNTPSKCCKFKKPKGEEENENKEKPKGVEKDKPNTEEKDTPKAEEKAKEDEKDKPADEKVEEENKEKETLRTCSNLKREYSDDASAQVKFLTSDENDESVEYEREWSSVGSAEYEPQPLLNSRDNIESFKYDPLLLFINLLNSGESVEYDSQDSDESVKHQTKTFLNAQDADEIKYHLINEKIIEYLQKISSQYYGNKDKDEIVKYLLPVPSKNSRDRENRVKYQPMSEDSEVSIKLYPRPTRNSRHRVEASRLGGSKGLDQYFFL